MDDADLLPSETWTRLRGEFPLRPGVTYLNHGSFGPPPRAVTAAQRLIQDTLNANPMDFYVRRWDELWRSSTAQIGAFVGTAGMNLTFLPNATTAMNVVADSFILAPGDEVLLNDHEYGAVFRIWEKACRVSGAKLVTARLPFPLTDAEEITAAIFKSVTRRTRLIVVSHVASATAVVMPVAAICRRAAEQAIAVAVDGPHAVGMRDLQIDSLDCDFYCASCHKWLSAPLGSGFLYVHPRRQGDMQPLATSWGKRTGSEVPATWTDEFRWSGTSDPSAYFAIPAAIEFLQVVEFDRFRRHTHALMREARRRIEAVTGLPAFVPDDAAWYGSMLTMPLPPGDAPRLQQRLWERHGIEILLHEWNGNRYVRPSFHLYNSRDDLDCLIAALDEELKVERGSPRCDSCRDLASTARQEPGPPSHCAPNQDSPSMTDAETAGRLTQMITGYWPAQAIYVAAKLGIADQLKNGPRSVDDLAAATGTKPDFLFRLLRALASLGIFAEGEPRSFGLTPTAELLRSDMPGSQRSLALMMGEEHYMVWSKLLDAVQTGDNAFQKMFGSPIFEWLSTRPDQAQIFDGAMTGIHGRETAAVLDAYDFSVFNTLCDVGGGNGSKLAAILQRHPNVRGMLFDLPHVVDRAEPRLREAGVLDRCTLVRGSFFEPGQIPAGADAILMRHIIHDWTDEQSLTILRNAHAALPAGGKLLLVESVIPPGNGPFATKFLDLTMMLIPGGKERTAAEYRELYEQAGFDLTRIVATTSEISVIEGIKR